MLFGGNRAISHWKADGLDLSPILAGPSFPATDSRIRSTSQDHELEKHFERQRVLRRAFLASIAWPLFLLAACDSGKPTPATMEIFILVDLSESWHNLDADKHDEALFNQAATAPKKLLANPLIEDYEARIREPDRSLQ